MAIKFEMSREEQLRALKRQYNLTDSQAKQALDRSAPIRAFEVAKPVEPVLEIPLPIAIVFPWSCLVSDDKRFAPALRGDKAALVMTEAYREAKKKAEPIAINAAAGFSPRSGALELIAKVYVPDNHRRDVQNFSKCLLDVLSGVIYKDDSQLEKTTIERAGVDCDAPRAEVLIRARGL